MKIKLRESKANKKLRSKNIIKILKDTYPDSKCSLVYNSPHELLVATMLSAQCTDNRVNKVTELLFKKYKSPNDFAYCNINELSKDIHSCGYHNQKAKNIQSASLTIIEEYGGKVPNNIEQLINSFQNIRFSSNDSFHALFLLLPAKTGIILDCSLIH